jgi:hypothetical protein
VILRNRPDVVAQWSDTEVALRWFRLCPVRKQAGGTSEEPTAAELDTIRQQPQRLAEIRRRLTDISWFMRMVSERVARWANAEDQCAGRFWQGRFRAVRLCDEAAILACSLYVDLNPIRAGECQTPEASRHTSAKRRLEERQQSIGVGVGADSDSQPAPQRTAADWLAPLPLHELGLPGAQTSHSRHRASDKGFLPMTLDDYLSLLDWTGRQLVPDKRGAIPAHLEPILERLGLNGAGVLKLATGFGELFRRVAGSVCSVRREAARRGRRWYQAPGGRLLRTLDSSVG